METKAKKRLFNIIMVLLILVIVGSGVFAVGKIQGWFDRPEEAVMTSGTVKGIANIERKGIGYTLNSGTVLYGADVIETKKGAQAELVSADQGKFVLNGNTELTLTECETEAVRIQLAKGELFGDSLSGKYSLLVDISGNQATLSNAVFSASAQSGSSTLNIYAGDVKVILSDGTQERVEAGEYLSVVEEEDGSISYEIEPIYPASLNEFLIAQAQNCGSTDSLCFTGAQLQQILDDRAAEKQAALEASLNAEVIRAKEETQTPEAADEVLEREKSVKGEADGEEPVNDADAGEDDAAWEDQNSVEEYVPEVQEEIIEEDRNICTITILCDTILDNMDNLDDGKEAYVPANGTILATSSVEFEEGETVFEVLNRVCEYAGIQIEYSWNAIYNSYYIEGINHLYEFDCGNESGWMYKVNGWFPNYGCSSYYLEDGDNIVWCYTCNGLGADVGGSVR